MPTDQKIDHIKFILSYFDAMQVFNGSFTY